jgi:hypothetical protein
MDDMQPIGPTRHYVIVCHDGGRIDVDDGRNARDSSPRPPGRLLHRDERRQVDECGVTDAQYMTSSTTPS